MSASLEPEIVSRLEQRYGEGCVVSVSSDHPVGPPTGLRLSDGTMCRIRRLRPLGDWIARATSDERMRAYQIASSGVLRSLPAGVSTAVVDAIVFPNGAAVIERVLPDDMAPSLEPLLVGLARLHSAFVGFPARLTAGLGLSPLAAWLTLYAPATLQRHPDAPAEIAEGWDALRAGMPSMWASLEPTFGSPTVMVEALRTCPATILHGNAIPGNVAATGDGVVLGDWSQAVRGPGALDLGVVLVGHAEAVAGHLSEAVEVYRAERGRVGRLPSSGEVWERELRLGLIAGLIRYGWRLGDDMTTEAFERYLD